MNCWVDCQGPLQFVAWSDEKFIAVQAKRRRFWSSTSLSTVEKLLVWFFIGFVYPVLNPEAMERRRRAELLLLKLLYFFSSFQSTTRSVIAHSIMVLYFDPKCMNWYWPSRTIFVWKHSFNYHKVVSTNPE